MDQMDEKMDQKMDRFMGDMNKIMGDMNKKLDKTSNAEIAQITTQMSSIQSSIRTVAENNATISLRLHKLESQRDDEHTRRLADDTLLKQIGAHTTDASGRPTQSAINDTLRKAREHPEERRARERAEGRRDDQTGQGDTAKAPADKLDHTIAQADGTYKIVGIAIVTTLRYSNRRGQSHIVGSRYLDLEGAAPKTPQLGEAMLMPPVTVLPMVNPGYESIGEVFQDSVNTFETGLKTLLRNACHDAQCSQVLGDAIHSVMTEQTEFIPWPSEWNEVWMRNQQGSAPNFMIITRVQLGMCPQDYVLLNTPSDKAKHEEAIQACVLKVVEAASHRHNASASRVISTLSTGYTASRGEWDIVVLLIRMLTREPQLFLPVQEEVADDIYRAPRPHSHSVREVERIGSHSREPRLRESQYLQLIELKVFPAWKDNTSLLAYHTAMLQAWSRPNGALCEHVSPLLEAGTEKAINAVRRAVMHGMVSKSAPELTDILNLPRHITEWSTVSQNLLIVLDAACDRSTSSAATDVHEAFIDCVREILLGLRAAAYSETVEHQARRELRRLARISRPPGIADATWVRESLHRLRNHRKLAGDLRCSFLSNELSDYVTRVVGSIHDPTLANLALRHANTWISTVATSLGQPGGARALPGMQETVRDNVQDFAALLTDMGREARDTKNEDIFLKAGDLVAIHQVGAKQHDKHGNSMGVRFMHDLLSYILDKCFPGSRGMDFEEGADTPSTTNMLTLDPPYLRLVNDDIASPDVLPGRNDTTGTDVPILTTYAVRDSVFRMDAARGEETSQLKSQLETMDAEHKSNIDKITRQHEHEMAEYRKQTLKSNAHLSELMQRQLENTADPAMAHARNAHLQTANQDLTKSVHFADGTRLPQPASAMQQHDQDRRRNNLGGSGGGQRFQTGNRTGYRGVTTGVGQRRPQTAPAPDGAPKLMYQDKPITPYSDIPPDTRAKLATATNNIVVDEDTYRMSAQKLCLLPCCNQDGRPANHWLGHCVVLWCQTDKGVEYMGVTKAAARAAKLDGTEQTMVVADLLCFYDDVVCTLCDYNENCDLDSLTLATCDGVDRVLAMVSTGRSTPDAHTASTVLLSEYNDILTRARNFGE